jgi:hypothetical protein
LLRLRPHKLVAFCSFARPIHRATQPQLSKFLIYFPRPKPGALLRCTAMPEANAHRFFPQQEDDAEGDLYATEMSSHALLQPQNGHADAHPPENGKTLLWSRTNLNQHGRVSLVRLFGLIRSLLRQKTARTVLTLGLLMGALLFWTIMSSSLPPSTFPPSTGPVPKPGHSTTGLVEEPRVEERIFKVNSAVFLPTLTWSDAFLFHRKCWHLRGPCRNTTPICLFLKGVMEGMCLLLACIARSRHPTQIRQFLRPFMGKRLEQRSPRTVCPIFPPIV